MEEIEYKLSNPFDKKCPHILFKTWFMRTFVHLLGEQFLFSGLVNNLFTFGDQTVHLVNNFEYC
ncbi:hypothetical protein BpHYR1_053183 [Brachionus plicatilis]|uniref:Uncharacterized protein n=1 Tax=Brachionus plicatilis TaxID=10195 RepID=A0A3M7S2C4_BRAPC|nr:hypothetical protein BpHYR1_053183 [Brachionus plicatilis]